MFIGVYGLQASIEFRESEPMLISARKLALTQRRALSFTTQRGLVTERFTYAIRSYHNRDLISRCGE